MNRIKYLLLPVLLGLTSCEDYLDVNESTNDVQYEFVTPSHLLPGAQLDGYRSQMEEFNELGNLMMNNWAADVNNFAGANVQEYQLNFDNSIGQEIWDDFFPVIAVYQDIIDFEDSNGKYNNYKAIAHIMKAYYMQYIVDLYGDAPYREAFMRFKNTTPGYDDDQFIYRSLLDGLDKARSLFSNSTNMTLPIDTNIIGFGTGINPLVFSSTTNWYEFANTLELRMLLRMSNNTGSVAAYRDARLAALSGASFLTVDVRINPGFNADTNSKMNPFVNRYFISSSNTMRTNYRSICASWHIAQFLNGSTAEIVPGENYPGVADPRRSRMFSSSSNILAAATTVNGVAQGGQTGDPDVSSSPSRLGVATFVPYFETVNISPPSLIDFYAKASGMIMSLPEIEFLQAEAALRYPAWFSNAQAHFDNGVGASIRMWNLPISTIGTVISNYRSAIVNINGLGWSGSFQDKLKAIMTQKWISLANIGAMETFIDYTRTGYPTIPLAKTAQKPNKPVRLIYPFSEYAFNSDNVPVVSPADIFSVNGHSPFWLQGDPALVQ